jgi:hypothetical protein
METGLKQALMAWGSSFLAKKWLKDGGNHALMDARVL